jgi:ketosteroid isomerase-like protein
MIKVKFYSIGYHFLLFLFLLTACSHTRTQQEEKELAEKIISLEKSALDRWGKGDPNGYIELFASEVTYFNPFEAHRIDGFLTMRKYYGDQAGQIFIDQYEMRDPRVQIHGNTAILTYHLYNYKRQSDGTLKETTRWNSTKVYALINKEWKIIHNHWSLIQPELKQQ